MAALTPDAEYTQLMRMRTLQRALQTILKQELARRSVPATQLAQELRMTHQRLQRFIDGTTALTLRLNDPRDRESAALLATLVRAALKGTSRAVPFTAEERELLIGLESEFDQNPLIDRQMGMTLLSPVSLSLYRDLRAAHQRYCPQEPYRLFACAFDADADIVERTLEGRVEALQRLEETTGKHTRVSEIGQRLLSRLQDTESLTAHLNAQIRAEDATFARLAEAYTGLFTEVRGRLAIGTTELYRLMKTDRTHHGTVAQRQRGSISHAQLQDRLRKLIAVATTHNIPVSAVVQALATDAPRAPEPVRTDEPVAPAQPIEGTAPALPANEHPTSSPVQVLEQCSDQELIGELALRMARGQIPNTVLLPYARPIPPLVGDTDAGLEHCVVLLEATHQYLTQLARSGTPFHQPTLRSVGEIVLAILQTATGGDPHLLKAILKKGAYATSLQDVLGRT